MSSSHSIILLRGLLVQILMLISLCRIRAWSLASSYNNCFHVIARWYGEKPETPDSLKNIPALWLQESQGDYEGDYDHRHRVSQWIREGNELRRRYRTMAQDLGDKLSDEELRGVLQRPPGEWKEHAVFQIIPREHEEPIDELSAKDILRAAVDIAVYKRLSQIDS